MQEAASRARVERRMGDLQAQLSALEGQLHARSHKVEQFVDERNRKISEGQRLAVSGALERSQLVNSMGKMRENLKAASSMYIDMPAARRNVQNPELKALLARVDPEGDGRVAFSSMRKTLNKLLPPPDEPGAPRSRHLGSQSLPSLSASFETQKKSRYERALAAFKALDADGSGEISKRELYKVLKEAGLSNGKQALEVFAGADADQSGQLSFEEFQTIAVRRMPRRRVASPAPPSPSPYPQTLHVPSPSPWNRWRSAEGAPAQETGGGSACGGVGVCGRQGASHVVRDV